MIETALLPVVIGKQGGIPSSVSRQGFCAMRVLPNLSVGGRIRPLDTGLIRHVPDRPVG